MDVLEDFWTFLNFWWKTTRWQSIQRRHDNKEWQHDVDQNDRDIVVNVVDTTTMMINVMFVTR